MRRTTIISLLILLLLSACGGEAEETPIPTNTPVPPTRTVGPTRTPRKETATPSPTITVVQATNVINPTFTPEVQLVPDFSGVTLYEATHLMDPRMFQVSMDGWPEGVPEDVIVRVGMEFYTCDVLVPDRYPNRVYCWGPAPPKGTTVNIQVILEDVPLPLLEIPFVVPYPNEGDN